MQPLNDNFADQRAELVSVLEVLDQPAVLLSPEYRILGANRAYLREYGRAGDSGRQYCYEVSHHYVLPCDQAGESCPLKRCRATGQPQRNLHLHHTPRGEEHVDVEMYPIWGRSGRVEFFVEVMRSSYLASSNPRAGGLVGRSPAFNKALELVQRVAASKATVLLLGESGTGKELFAKAIHDASTRAKGPFVPVECSGLTETLFESELFGHEKGAFTGAHSQKIGLVEAARGGTLFFDEIGDIPLSLQVKLLRLLETGTYRRVGGIESHKADFRLVCATHRDLKNMVGGGRFRQDLYYRINAFPIELPPLRDRIEDLPLLSASLLRRITGKRKITFSDTASDCLKAYSFPGNIRELRNIIERAVLLTDGDLILPEHLPPECRDAKLTPGEALPDEIMTLDEMQHRYVMWALTRFTGDKRTLARRLGVSERTLYRKLQDARKEPEGE